MSVLTVPGNLLLLGEYAVLEPGGLGIAVAIDRRVAIDITDAQELTIAGRVGKSSELWTERDRSAKSLVGQTLRAALCELESRGHGSREPALSLRIDSSALYDAEGGKIGLGSSAAVAVGVALALLARAGEESSELEAAAFRAALEGHRAYQGGRGSGYDVAASLYGGFGLFVGGMSPSFERLELDWMPPFSLVRGRASVDTTGAIARYEAWKREKPEAAANFLRASNEIVSGFASAASWAEASVLLREGARLAAGLGDAIGVPARVGDPSGHVEGRVAKALGAGDELVAVWPGGSASSGETGERAEVSRAGPSWSE